MKRWLSFLAAGVLFAVLHEGTHVLMAGIFGEFEPFHFRPFGLEVTFNTPLAERSGIQWALISGAANAVTLLAGYILYSYRNCIAACKNWFLKTLMYYAAILFLLLDAFNLSLGPFIYGGDANRIAAGLGINRWIIQVFFLLVLLLNRELIAQKLLPAFNVKTVNFIFKPLLKFKH